MEAALARSISRPSLPEAEARLAPGLEALRAAVRRVGVDEGKRPLSASLDEYEAAAGAHTRNLQNLWCKLHPEEAKRLAPGEIESLWSKQHAADLAEHHAGDLAKLSMEGVWDPSTFAGLQAGAERMLHDFQDAGADWEVQRASQLLRDLQSPEGKTLKGGLALANDWERLAELYYDLFGAPKGTEIPSLSAGSRAFSEEGLPQEEVVHRAARSSYAQRERQGGLLQSKGVSERVVQAGAYLAPLLTFRSVDNWEIGAAPHVGANIISVRFDDGFAGLGLAWAAHDQNHHASLGLWNGNHPLEVEPQDAKDQILKLEEKARATLSPKLLEAVRILFGVQGHELKAAILAPEHFTSNETIDRAVYLANFGEYGPGDRFGADAFEKHVLFAEAGQWISAQLKMGAAPP